MSSVVISGDTSGAITLAAPSVAGTNTITLPASTGTVLTTGSPQSGGVIQVVNATYATQISTTSSSYADTGLTASITPKFSTSKILVLVSISSLQKNSSNAQITLNLVRNSTQIIVLGDSLLFNNPVGELEVAGPSTNYLDSPATTSSTTYKVQWKSNGIGTVYMNSGGVNASTITLMEIAA